MNETDILPVMRPNLPTYRHLEAYLKQIDDNRWYTNYGPLAHAFEQRLAEHFGTVRERVVTACNGTVALIQILQALDRPVGSLCVMPSWTFVATAAAAKAAGFTPLFADVDLNDWTLSLGAVELLAAEYDIGVVVAVAPFGAPFDYVSWEAFSRRTGIPVVVDAAAGFDTHRTNGPSPIGQLTTMVSLHATKVFGIGEGACIVAQTPEVAHAIRLQGNFGFDSARRASVAGINTKMSEYTAAVGLASFDVWQHCRAEWAALTDRHATMLAELGIGSMPGFGLGWISCYGLARLPDSISFDMAADAFNADRIETRSWWGLGCLSQPAYARFASGDLQNTAALAGQVIGLPFWQGMDESQFHRIRLTLSKLAR